MHKGNEEEEGINSVGKLSSLDADVLEKSMNLPCSPLHLLPHKSQAHDQVYPIPRSGL